MQSINIEYKNVGEYPVFFEKIKGKRVCVAYDINTKPYALPITEKLQKLGCEVKRVAYPDEELIPDEKACMLLEQEAEKSEYILAVGSGTLNDMAKYVSTLLEVPCGVLATAPSRDGYCSKGSALMIAGKKLPMTYICQATY